jgi:hypothetical protein
MAGEDEEALPALEALMALRKPAVAARAVPSPILARVAECLGALETEIAILNRLLGRLAEQGEE